MPEPHARLGKAPTPKDALLPRSVCRAECVPGGMYAGQNVCHAETSSIDLSAETRA